MGAPRAASRPPREGAQAGANAAANARFCPPARTCGSQRPGRADWGYLPRRGARTPGAAARRGGAGPRAAGSGLRPVSAPRSRDRSGSLAERILRSPPSVYPSESASPQVPGCARAASLSPLPGLRPNVRTRGDPTRLHSSPVPGALRAAGAGSASRALLKGSNPTRPPPPGGGARGSPTARSWAAIAGSPGFLSCSPRQRPGGRGPGAPPLTSGPHLRRCGRGAEACSSRN